MVEAFLDAHNDEISDLGRKFSSYFTSISRDDVRIWLRQFQPDHLHIALRLLQAVDFYSPPRITYAYRTAHEQFLATINSDSLEGVTFFPFGHAGKSGSSMSHFYGNANGIHVSKFKYFSEITRLFGEGHEAEPKLVFIDDFIGTGSQAIETWERLREIPFPREARSFLLTLVAFDEAIEKVTDETDLQVITPRVLSEENRLFSPMNRLFSKAEKDILRGYCERVGQSPMGFGNCQALVVFHYKSPDNVVSILRGETEDWKPLFPRIF